MAATDLCELSDVKLLIGPDSKTTDEEENQIKALITSKTQAITSYIGMNQILAKDYTDEKYDSDGEWDNTLYTYNLPINSVTSLYSDANRTFTDDTLISSSNYEIINNEYILLKPGYYFNKGKGSIKITYNAGYATIPEDLKQVCIDEVSRAYSEKPNIGISSRSDSQGSITRYEKGFLKSSLQVLSKYIKRMAL